MWRTITLAAAATLITGCAASNEAHPSIEAARVALREAERNEAPRFASSEYALARDKLNAAIDASDRSREERARRLAEQALIDARVAATRAQNEQLQSAMIRTPAAN